MGRSMVERKLVQVTERLARARHDLRVADEQLAALGDAADEARIRALVSETPVAEKELDEARRHAEAMRRSRDRVLTSIADLEKAKDDLLARLPSNPP